MKNVKKLLIFAAISTFVFASWTRTNALGGNAGYWADDYANITAFPASVNDHNVAYTNGSNFTTIFDHDGTKWGFSGGTGNDDVINMHWGNGNLGVSFGLSMTPESDAVAYAAAVTTNDDPSTVADESAGNSAEVPATAAVEASTDFNIGVGMPLAGGDFGFTYDGSTIGVNLRRAQSVWLWDNMLINFDMTPEDTDAGTASDMNLGINCYSNNSYDGGTSALIALGFEYGSMGCLGASCTAPDATMNLVWTFAVESAMTDWADLRVGYSKAHDFGGGSNSGGTVSMGLGFNYGSFNLDMMLNDYNGLFNDPVKYVSGRNDNALGASWTISYNW